MKTKLACLLLFIPLLLSAARTVTIIWDDPDNPAGTVDAYCVYEQSGTNWIKVGTVTNLTCQLVWLAGQHSYVVTASNYMGESEFSNVVVIYNPKPPKNTRASK